MVDGIVDHHDLAVDVDGVRDIDVPAQHAGDRLGHVGLAVPGVPVQEHRLGRIDGRAELLDELGVEDQMPEPRLDAVHRDVDLADGLDLDPQPVGLQGDRRRPDVLVGGHGLAGPIAPLPGQVVEVAAATVSGRPANLDELPRAQRFGVIRKQERRLNKPSAT